MDDGFHSSLDMFDAPDCAVALWVKAGSWCAEKLTDGRVPETMPSRLCEDPERAVEELIRRKVWKRTRDGYKFIHWAPAQKLKKDVEGERAAWRAKKENQRGDKKPQARGENAPDVSPGDTRRDAPGDAPRTPSGSPAGVLDTSSSSGSSSSPKDDPPPSPPTDRGEPDGREDDPAARHDETDLIAAVAEVIGEVCGRPASREHARKVCRQILDGREVRHPLRYVTTAIRKDPALYAPPAVRPSERPPSEAIAPGQCGHGAANAAECALCRRGMTAYEPTS
ncbi:hypothetical protein [Actinocorallia herbida]|uniref:hypothetical protein n=1 Tax=Actinocorallia herbida TaxID=58109 RepID=UPI0011CDCC64|nr:hypothetical protein [Actinocorallia herbida]